MASYSDELLIEKVSANLSCLEKNLHLNKKEGFDFFRIGSGIIPFASHPVCTCDWVAHSAADLRRIGSYIKRDGVIIIDYSEQAPQGRRCVHKEHITPGRFRKFIDEIAGIDCDVMLEIKDKEKSAYVARKIVDS
ncbi:MAG: hypothetical protein GF398_14170 [Chitinivibrionales bacterium]|nr:hypothetical protein [Chitinivibrionales bacterium]